MSSSAIWDYSEIYTTIFILQVDGQMSLLSNIGDSWYPYKLRRCVHYIVPKSCTDTSARYEVIPKKSALTACETLSRRLGSLAKYVGPTLIRCRKHYLDTASTDSQSESGLHTLLGRVAIPAS